MIRQIGLCVAVALLVSCASAPEHPNILWITSEDNGPHLGAYGDSYADTPRLDALASGGMIYSHAWSNAPVCAPARTTIISGVYPQSLGAEHMRSQVAMPDGMLMYPQYLRQAGYYASNNVKEDYNIDKPGEVWDDSSNEAHWRNREPDQPFFAIFNFTTTHESQIRSRPYTAIHDPAAVRVPAYHPDTPESRQDWAQYYDKMTEMDTQAGEILDQLAEDGLTDDTIIFYYGDHGAGMPRSKRFPYNSGLQVPLIVYIPEKYRALAPDDWEIGGATDHMAGFVDLAPTVLSLAGVEPPEFIQGHAFLGRYAAEAPQYLFGFRGRMDERYDLIRAVRDERYIYLRNYMPHRIYGQYVAYMFQTPTTAVWKELYDAGELEPPRTYFWETKPSEELYDLEADPDETQNLAGDAQYREIVERMHAALREQTLRIRDVGFLPENEIHSRSEGMTPYEMGHNDELFPLERVYNAAEMASSPTPVPVADLVALLADDDSAVRYWGATGLLIRGPEAVADAREALVNALDDPAPAVRIAASEALGRYGSDAESRRALEVLLELADAEQNGIYLGMMAVNAIDYMDERALWAKDRIEALPRSDPNANNRFAANVGRAIDKTLADLE